MNCDVVADLNSFSIQVSDQVALVKITGANSGNAMGVDFLRELPMIFGELDADPDVKPAAGRVRHEGNPQLRATTAFRQQRPPEFNGR